MVVDPRRTETAALADVVLPSAQWAEEDGTMTNLEGRVILRSRARPAPGDVRTDLEAIVAIADALGHGALFPSSRARDVFEQGAKPRNELWAARNGSDGGGGLVDRHRRFVCRRVDA